MSRVIVVGHCVNCPYRDIHILDNGADVDWCQIVKREPVWAMGHSFPAWCPLPEKKEESK